MRVDIVAGAVFPDYELSDHRGKHHTLSELQGDDPLVLVLSRGGYCLAEATVRETEDNMVFLLSHLARSGCATNAGC